MTVFTFDNKWLLFLFIKFRMTFDEINRSINVHSKGGKEFGVIRIQNRINKTSQKFRLKNYFKVFQ